MGQIVSIKQVYTARTYYKINKKVIKTNTSQMLCLLRITSWLPVILRAFWPFKVISFYINWKPIYDFLLMINCNLALFSTISKTWCCELQSKPSHPSLSPNQRVPLQISSSNLLSCIILALVNLSQYTHMTERWQTDDILWQWLNFAMQCNCNVWLLMEVCSKLHEKE